MNQNVIYGINGPVVTVRDTDSFEMMEMVHVGVQNLVGEVIGITDKLTTIQVYEETTGLKPGDPVTGTGAPMNVLLGPGIIDNIFDGIERPLKAIEEQAGAFINRGASVTSLDTERLWNVTMKIKIGDKLDGGQIYATIPETPIIEHRLMLHPDLSGVVTEVKPDGEYKIFDTVAVIEDDLGEKHELKLCQLVRRGHHHLRRLRRARKRNEPGSRGILRAYRPEIEPPDDRQNRAYREHLQHARCGA